MLTLPGVQLLMGCIVRSCWLMATTVLKLLQARTNIKVVINGAERPASMMELASLIFLYMV